jgi:cellulose synthase/poly-beta-1,6-N-acetylglucosamine synthase-like glycosyltransferase/predicted Zn-dependent protease
MLQHQHQRYRQLVIVLSLAICLYYLTYRLLFTLNVTTAYAATISVFLLLGEAYGVFVMVLFYLQVWDSREPAQQPVLPGRTVDVFVPTYNEDPQLLRATIEACSRLDYPHTTYLCDDGGTDARLAHPQNGPAARARAEILKAMCAELGAVYVPRPDNRHAKAGNLNHAFAKTHGEFIIILDADHVPEPNFISRLIGYFRDDKLGFVQTPHAFYNFNNFQARYDHKNRRYWEEGHLFYEVIQPGRNRWHCPIFAGSAAMFRRKALAEVGYIATETITEDMHTGMRVNARGWKSLAISERLVAGQAAPDVTTFHTQRIRWGEGNLSIMAYDNPLTMRGLKLGQRFCYLGSMVHWAGGLFKMAIYLTPILMMFSGVAPVNEFTWTLAALTVLYLIASVQGVRIASNGFGSFFNGELFCMINFWTQVRGTMRALFWRKFQSFVVTSKRGRQAKSVWPYLRPQVYLVAVSVAALVWGWGRLVAGISDDYFKPIIPTFWIVFHMILALTVLRRALWPEDRRFSTRHLVQLPVAYEARGGAKGLAITADLNEIGVGLITYEPLAVDDVLNLTLWGRGESVCCEGVVRNVHELTPGGKNGTVPRGFRVGVAFHNLRPAQTDGLNRICLHYAVARLYAEYAEGRERTLWWRAGRWVLTGGIRRRYALRREVHMPLVIDPHGRRGGPVYTVTEDVSRAGAAALLADPLPPDTEAEFLLATPLGPIWGLFREIRKQPRVYAARTYHLCAFEFTDFKGQGRVTLGMVLNRRENPDLDPVVKPEPKPLRVPLRRPALVALAAGIPLLIGTLVGFRFTYRDEFFLRDIARAERPITEDEVARVETIFGDTLKSRYPSNDRLVLLTGALTRLNRPREMDQVTMLLAPRDRKNLDLQFALAQTLDNHEDSQRAEAEYTRVLAEVESGNLPARRQRELLLAAARASVHAGNLDRAGTLFDRLLAAAPNEMAIRNEYAGVLMGADHFAEAARLYDGVEPDMNGRLLLVAIQAQANDFDAAEKEARRIVQLRPDDPEAKLLLADVLSWRKGGYRQSRAIYEQLRRANGDSPDLLLRLAQVSLWSRNYNEALERYQALIEGRLDNPDVVKGYVDAAASADQLGDAQARTAVEIYDHTLTGTAEDPVFLSRLAWVLQRVKELDKCATLLDRAAALNPRDPTVRRQMLGAFVATGRWEDALREFEGKELDYDTRVFVINIYLKQKNFVGAAAECRQLVEQKPNDPKALRMLADILSWKRDYKGSLAVLRQLAAAAPEDAEVPVREAEVTLWSGDYDAALARYQALLDAKFGRRELWGNYAAAAANAKELTAGHRQTLLRLADASGESKDGTFLGRLAWALTRLKDEKAAALADRAEGLTPEKPEARKELAGVLAALGRTKPALRLYDGLTLDLEDHYRLAALYAADKNFAAAAEECRAVLKERPDDRKALRQLADVLSWKKDYVESVALFERLAQADPADTELRLRLAEVLLWKGDYDRALDRFAALLTADFEQPALWVNFVNAAASAHALNASQAALARRIVERITAKECKDVTLLTRMAWVLCRLKDTDQATALLDRVQAQAPQEPAARKELAGVLAAAGRNNDALRLYEGLPLDAEDHARLAALYSTEQDFASAEVHCRAVLQAKPDDSQALRRLADVLSWKKDYAGAVALFEKMSSANPADPELGRRLAEVLLWQGQHDKALLRFQALLEASFDQPDLWRDYVDAAAGAHQFLPAQAQLAVRIAEQMTRGEPKDPILLARLAWVLYRMKEKDRAGALIDRAATLRPDSPVARREVAGVLAALGRTKAALRLYEGLALDVEDRYRLTELYAADGDFDAAEAQCKALLRDRPEDRRALRQLAGVLTWKKDYAQALPLLKKLAAADPANPELPLRLAELMLWTGDYDKALERFQGLVEANFDQTELWHSFVDAAASARRLTDAQKALAVRIYERTVNGESKDAAFLARLAWLLSRAKEPAKAGILLDQAVALKPADPGVRKELAGTLAAVGKFREALRMYEGLALDSDDRYHLVGIYATALLKCRDSLEEDPDDAEARKQLEYVHGWKKTAAESVALLQKTAADSPGDRQAQVRAAEVTLWFGAYPEAVQRFGALLEEQFEQPELWRPFIDAAASSETGLTAAQTRTVDRICELRAEAEERPEYLSRLAWVLYRLKETPKVDKLLDRALALKPEEPAVRRELAGVLAAAGRHEEARRLYAGLKLTFADRYRLAEIDIAARRYEEAEKQVNDILHDRPDDLRAELLMAAVLSGTHRSAEASRLYRKLLREHPGDRAIPAKLAELALAAGDYDNALAQYQDLLDRDPDRPALWGGYIDAAASASRLTDKVRPMAVRIADGLRDREAAEPTFLARTAWVLRRVKETGRSIALLEKALALEPNSRATRQQLAEALYEKGDYAGAEKQYKALLQAAPARQAGP